jgi:hypothetical protein
MILSFILISKYADDSTLILEDDTQSLNHANFSAIWLREGYSAFVYLLTVDSVSYHDKNQTKSAGLVQSGLHRNSLKINLFSQSYSWKISMIQRLRVIFQYQSLVLQ